jgi:hypothetical protein
LDDFSGMELPTMCWPFAMLNLITDVAVEKGAIQNNGNRNRCKVGMNAWCVFQLFHTSAFKFTLSSFVSNSCIITFKLRPDHGLTRRRWEEARVRVPKWASDATKSTSIGLF